ncbi:MAG: exodeoxyribonuclease III [Lentisphaerae bacterium]|nr:exodeoxyribonuclease III [Lentisphaerota bacterium]
MKIATFNANSIRSRLEIVIGWLRKNNPDVLCIQETKVQDADFPSTPFLDSGYNIVFKGEKSYNGVAIASKLKPTLVSFGFDDNGPPDETRLAHAKIGAVHIVNTYVPQGRDIEHPMFKYKIDWFKRLRSYMAKHLTAKMHVIWLGDMNVAPEPIDIHNAESQKNHVCYHADARAAFAHVIEWGFVDVFRMHHPEPGQYSFFDYRLKDALQTGRGWRVDHILATKPLAKLATNSFIDLKPRMQHKPSDHTFVVADFKI